MIIQGSEAWFDARRGKATASRVADIIAKTKTGWGASRKNYAAQLIAERLTGKTADSYSNAIMQWGTDTEPEARTAYEFYTDADVVEIGFVNHPDIEMCGASPDGIIGEGGMVEIKCPNTATHIDTLRGQAVPKKYTTQMQFQMACTGADWCDFVSYDPRMPDAMRLFVARVGRDGELIESLAADVTDFLKEIDDTVAELLKTYSQEKADA